MIADFGFGREDRPSLEKWIAGAKSQSTSGREIVLRMLYSLRGNTSKLASSLHGVATDLRAVTDSAQRDQLLQQ